MSSQARVNLEAVLNNLGYEIVAEIKKRGDSEKLLRLIDKALGVLANDGVYAYYVFCKAQDNDKSRDAEDIFIKLPLEKLKPYINLEINNNQSDKGEVEQYFSSLSEDLNKMLAFRNYMETALIYARYHAKAVKKSR
jgi:hypothetical protein